ncbi:hypothetical protein M409DRAFT_25024 [Zasmidium cellare ATCC 36951]|uniref:Uncharacterized protein n=1 Tax=Zasmidium cellare ATCC 36951 TaxID=1080233 RepID=A0A6A6CBR2_ZASCE|nr:uncharacterized protein M409DRAFT_25024 [Zasmidium cellare ATCC 36951]KAF2164627.1 hypothetical protein M409DRAFT_25024 [Zasmidium cellare ATCC 36951]
MPRAAVRVQGARNQTQWKISRGEHRQQHHHRHSYDSPPAYTPVDMQNHGHYHADHDPALPSYESYESYDGSGYGSPGSSRTSSGQYAQYNSNPNPKQPTAQVNGHYNEFDFRQSFNDQQRAHNSTTQPLTNGGHFDDFKFSVDDQVASHHISLNTNLREPGQDVVGRHLLYETALLDTQSFEILDISEVDELKKEHVRLNQRIDAASRKLALESKLKDAAQNIQRLYSGKKDGRPDTPQSPESPRKGRNSLLGNRGRASSGGEGLHQAEDELAQSIKKVDDLNEQIKSLLDRRQTVERKLLRHTAAVLAEQANQPPELRTDALSSNRQAYDRDELHLPGPDDFDGIRDILRGNPAPSSKQDLEKIKSEHEQQLSQMQGRLEHLNSQLRGVITEASQTRSQAPPPEPAISQSLNPRERLDSTVSIIESNMRTLEQGQATNLSQNAVEDQLEALNAQLHRTLQISEAAEPLKSLPLPPQSNGQGYQNQLQYLEQSLVTIDKLLRHHNDELQNVKQASGTASREMEDAMSKGESHAKKAAEYETVLSGLWEIVSAEPSGLTPRGSVDDGSTSARNSRGDRSPLKEDFSLQAFSSRVQHLYDVANGAREQQDILRRQIQQQRDLNGKSDMEKEGQIAEMQNRYDKLQQSYDATQQDLAKAMASHEQAEREATETRNEMTNVMNELEQFKQTIDDTQAKQRDVDSRHTQIVAEKDEIEQRHTELQKQLEDQESEVVRLMTELTIARAELEAAHGTRSERQKEAGMQVGEMDALQKLKDQEIEDLKKTQEQQIETLRRENAERAKLLEQELQDMTNEFQEMTRESLELEKERGQLDGLIDGLRDRCDQLEAQLNDEKIKWMGIKSPGGAQQDGAPRETTSVMVLRQEFKKMMREARADGVRLLRAEQEERRKIEAQLRALRQDNGPMGRHNRQLTAPAGSSIASTHTATATTTNGASTTMSPTTNGGDTLSPASAANPPQQGGG